MRKRIFTIITAVAFLSVSQAVFSQDAPAPKAEAKPAQEEGPSVDIALDVATTYMWRGIDVYAGKFEADEKDDGAFNMAPSLMPSLTYSSPIEGLSFNIWMAYNATERDDEKGALRYADEVDFTAGYEFDNKAGSWSAAYIMYAYPTGGSTYSELVFGYTAPVMLSPSVSVAAADALGGSTLYYSFGIGHGIESGAISIEPSVSYNLWYLTNEEDRADFADGLKSHLDISIPVSYSISDKMSAGLSALISYRMYGKDLDKTIGVDGSEIDKQALKAAVSLSFAYSL
ncbi:MAG: hypothetical protein OEZ22_12120 [Spirochaetia bacterium]|nr:hypothetical protein [Spirochaetia bacterium]